MRERKYTLSEIDAMRSALVSRLHSRFWSENDCASGDYMAEIKRDAEEQLRTAMMAGVDPAEFGQPKEAT